MTLNSALKCATNTLKLWPPQLWAKSWNNDDQSHTTLQSPATQKQHHSSVNSVKTIMAPAIQSLANSSWPQPSQHKVLQWWPNEWNVQTLAQMIMAPSQTYTYSMNMFEGLWSWFQYVALLPYFFLHLNWGGHDFKSLHISGMWLWFQDVAYLVDVQSPSTMSKSHKIFKSWWWDIMTSALKCDKTLKLWPCHSHEMCKVFKAWQLRPTIYWYGRLWQSLC